MGSNIPRQETFFYKAKWSAEVDSVLLSVIIRAKNMGRWSGNVIPIPILQEAVESIESETGVSFSWLELYERYQFVEQRFHAFKLVWQTHGVYWNMQSNTVICPESAWKDLIQKNQLTAAYYYAGDIEYPRLAMLFGMEEVKEEKNTEVVVISDTTVPISGPRPRRGIGSSSPCGEASDSVSSPLAQNFATTRRKLFPEAYEGLDNEEGYVKTPVFSVPRREGKSEAKPATSSRNKSRPLPFNAAASPHRSSCGSTSPSNWWRNNIK